MVETEVDEPCCNYNCAHTMAQKSGHLLLESLQDLLHLVLPLTNSTPWFLRSLIGEEIVWSSSQVGKCCSMLTDWSGKDWKLSTDTPDQCTLSDTPDWTHLADTPDQCTLPDTPDWTHLAGDDLATWWQMCQGAIKCKRVDGKVWTLSSDGREANAARLESTEMFQQKKCRYMERKIQGYCSDVWKHLICSNIMKYLWLWFSIIQYFLIGGGSIKKWPM